jgi:hypothetical protein
MKSQFPLRGLVHSMMPASARAGRRLARTAKRRRVRTRAAAISTFAMTNHNLDRRVCEPSKSVDGNLDRNNLTAKLAAESGPLSGATAPGENQHAQTYGHFRVRTRRSGSIRRRCFPV